jgi:hypothetical protein
LKTLGKTLSDSLTICSMYLRGYCNMSRPLFLYI